jgi:preprotein translocase subunit SecY
VVQISVPGIDLDLLRNYYDSNSLLGVFSIMTGGSAENFSIVMMGLSPYINASIIIQLLTVIVPQLESLSKEGESGRKKINQYTRWLTLPLAFLQSYGMIALMNNQFGVQVVDIFNPYVVLPIMLTLSAGTVMLMWIGEIMSEKGIGNGISMIIFTGIMSNIPLVFGQQFGIIQSDLITGNYARITPFVATIVITLILTLIVILITEGQRQLQVTYASKGATKAQQGILPIRVNQAGMIPIIFAISMVNFPSILAQLFAASNSETLKQISGAITTYFPETGIAYALTYFLLIFAFTYFYVSITFNPDQVAENIQKKGGYIAGIRPGKETANYLEKISNRLNFLGGAFLAFIGVSPLLIQYLFQDLFATTSIPLVISGAGLIIIVGTILELSRQVNTHLISQDYRKFKF